jgi:hypothetical protein
MYVCEICGLLLSVYLVYVCMYVHLVIRYFDIIFLYFDSDTNFNKLFLFFKICDYDIVTGWNRLPPYTNVSEEGTCLVARALLHVCLLACALLHVCLVACMPCCTCLVACCMRALLHVCLVARALLHVPCCMCLVACVPCCMCLVACALLHVCGLNLDVARQRGGLVPETCITVHISITQQQSETSQVAWARTCCLICIHTHQYYTTTVIDNVCMYVYVCMHILYIYIYIYIYIYLLVYVRRHH